MDNYVIALNHLIDNPNITVFIDGVSYEDIHWDDERTQPTKAECDAVMAQALYENERRQVERQRQDRYEAETDGVFFDAMRADGDLTEWKALVEAIKAELPYPTEPS